MGNKPENKRKKRISPGKRRLFLCAAWMAVLLAAVSAAVYGMYRTVVHMQTRASLQSLQKAAAHDCLAAQQVLESRETAVRNWAYSLRGSGCTETGQILDSASRGCQIIGAKRLFLVDDGYFYYGSSGLVTQLPEYDACLQSLMAEVQTLRADGCMLVCVRVKPRDPKCAEPEFCRLIRILFHPGNALPGGKAAETAPSQPRPGSAC